MGAAAPRVTKGAQKKRKGKKREKKKGKKGKKKKGKRGTKREKIGKST